MVTKSFFISGIYFIMVELNGHMLDWAEGKGCNPSELKDMVKLKRDSFKID